MESKWSKRYKAVVKLMLLGVLFVVAFARCANVGTPSGGLKDTLPPRVIRISPEYGTTNFDPNQKQVIMEFNEYIQLKDQSKEMFVSPMLKSKPTMIVKGKSVVMTFKDTLAPNQTYAFNFGDAIVDNNESNPIKGFRYVVSTGATIDSLVISGYTVDAYTKDSVSKTFLYFYDAAKDSIPELDSTIFNHKPAAVARAFSNGIFLAENLKPVDYRIYALEDKNGNMTYEPGVDRIGFLDSVQNPLRLPEFGARYDTTRNHIVPDPQLYFRMFMDSGFKRQYMGKSARPVQHMAVISFMAPEPVIKSLSLEGIDSTQIIFQHLKPTRDSIALWLNVPKESLPDSIKGEITYLKHDSVNMLTSVTEKLLFTWRAPDEKGEKRGLRGLFGGRDSDDKTSEEVAENGTDSLNTVQVTDRETVVTPEPKRKKGGLIAFFKRLFGRFKKDSGATASTADGAKTDKKDDADDVIVNPFKSKVDAPKEFNPLNNIPMSFDYPLTTIDTAAISVIRVASEEKKYRVRFTLEQDSTDMRKWLLKAPWSVDQNYELMIPAGAFTNVAAETNDTIKSAFTVLSPDKFAKLKLNIKGKTPGSEYIVEIMNGDKVAQRRTALKEGEHEFLYIAPGKIRIRVVEDDNRNGEWDLGNMVNRIQPERVEYFMTSSGDEEIETKMNWELAFDVDMVELFAPLTMERVMHQLGRMEQLRLKKIEEDKIKSQQEASKKPNSRNAPLDSDGGFGGAVRDGNLPR